MCAVVSAVVSWLSAKHFGTIFSVSQKKGATLIMAITLSILGGFAKFFHCWKDQ